MQCDFFLSIAHTPNLAMNLCEFTYYAVLGLFLLLNLTEFVENLFCSKSRCFVYSLHVLGPLKNLVVQTHNINAFTKRQKKLYHDMCWTNATTTI